MARLTIHDLGPIHEMEMDIRQFNILIGEQATGKSTICKSIYFFREIKNILTDYIYSVIIDGYSKRRFPWVLNASVIDIFVQLFGYSWNWPDNLNMSYQYQEGITLTVCLNNTKKKRHISLNYSEQMKKAVRQFEEDANAYHQSLSEFDHAINFTMGEKARLHQEIENKVSALLQDDKNTYYMPAGRSLMTVLTNQKTRFDYGLIDLVNRKFMQLTESVQPRFDMGVSNVHKYYPRENRSFPVQEMAQQIIRSMKGEYVYKNGREYLEIPGQQERILINFASSGQQEALWIFNYLYIMMLREEKAFVIIEEPEAHAYPTLQREILEFIVQFMNLTGSTILVTTHSPYMLTCANNMYYGGMIMDEHLDLREDVAKILGKGRYIPTAEMSAFKLIADSGRTVTEHLLDEETNQLMPELLDEVSKEINEQYTKLFYLEEESGYFNTEER